MGYYSTSGTVVSLLTPIFGATDSLLTNSDYMNVALDSAKSFIDNYCDRDFLQHTDVVEFHDGNGRDSMNTYYYPLISLTYVVMYNQLMQSMRTFLDTEIIVHPEWGELFLPPIYPAFMADKPFSAMFGNIFIAGRRNIEIKYTYGYATVPSEIATASNLYAAAYLLKIKLASISGGVTSRSIDGYNENFSNVKGNPFGSIAESWEEQAKNIISRWKRISYRAI
jgi:alpha-N-acetylglucosamine transferase